MTKHVSLRLHTACEQIILLLVLYPFRLLAELTTPTECLICIDASSSNRSSTSQRIVIHELAQLLYSIKEAFLEPNATEVVIDHLHGLLEKVILYHFHLLHTRGVTSLDNVYVMDAENDVVKRRP